MTATARGTSPHPGIIVIKPTSSRAYYALRYVDPATGKTKQPKLDGVTNDDAARDAAVQLVQTLRTLRAPAATPAPAVRTKRESRTKGVVVIKPSPGRQYYALRYVDPSTGKTKQPKLDGVTTREGAEAAAETMSATLQRRKLDVTLAGGREYAGTTCSVREEVATYLAAVGRKVSRRGRQTSAVTLRRYRDGLEAFATWCESRGVLQLGQLSRASLAEWLTSRQAAPAHGHARRVSTVNQEVKPIRQMLVAAAIAGRVTHISSDAIRGALARMTQPAPTPRCYSVVEVRSILRAAMSYDDEPSKRRGTPALAPIVAVALLTGMRRGELASLQVRDVLFDAPSEYDPTITTGLDVIRLPAQKTKTHQLRDVAMAPYSPLLGELMHALIAKRPGHERVLRVGYVALGDYAWRLREFGAPADFSLKDLRSTCATYQSPLPGNAKAKAARLGHTLAVAEEHYLALPSGTPVTAENLETVMKCETEVRDIIARVHGSKKS